MNTKKPHDMQKSVTFSIYENCGFKEEGQDGYYFSGPFKTLKKAQKELKREEEYMLSPGRYELVICKVTVEPVKLPVSSVKGSK